MRTTLKQPVKSLALVAAVSYAAFVFHDIGHPKGSHAVECASHADHHSAEKGGPFVENKNHSDPHAQEHDCTCWMLSKTVAFAPEWRWTGANEPLLTKIYTQSPCVKKFFNQQNPRGPPAFAVV